MLTLGMLYSAPVQLERLRWRVTKRTEGRWWWKVTLYDAESQFVTITNLTAQQVASLPIY